MIDVKEKMAALRMGLEAVLAKGDLSDPSGYHYDGLCAAISHNSPGARTGSYTVLGNLMHGYYSNYIDGPKNKSQLTPTRMNVVLLLLELDDEDLALFYEEAPTV
ncbi:hypothetical protein HOU10_gp33 [Curvibacter phage P26059B]|uniref:Uncharacterized protein n=1 Tax=Curvibacter phage P26059B TaxID=1983784 RepID=A0A384UH58_9CAUD|nr:hypothetical protein HOU10_gp33 [Curvibacter phage P26059B]ASJ79309.1 hypothetical protein P26059B_0033 [Curvibacter phage P26059B]